MALLDILRVMIIVSMFLIFAGGTMVVDSLWATSVVQKMQAKGAMGFMVFELVVSLICAALIVGVVIQFISALLGNVFNLQTYGAGAGLSIPGLSLIALVLTIIVSTLIWKFIDFVIWHMPFIVLTCVVIFIIVGWAKSIIRTTLFG